MADSNNELEKRIKLLQASPEFGDQYIRVLFGITTRTFENGALSELGKQFVKYLKKRGSKEAIKVLSTGNFKISQTKAGLVADAVVVAWEAENALAASVQAQIQELNAEVIRRVSAATSAATLYNSENEFEASLQALKSLAESGDPDAILERRNYFQAQIDALSKAQGLGDDAFGLGDEGLATNAQIAAAAEYLKKLKGETASLWNRAEAKRAKEAEEAAEEVSKIAPAGYPIDQTKRGPGLLITSDPDPVTTRAEGGPLRKGQLALVGEEGPEFFIPGADGHVLSNPDSKKLAGMMGEGARALAEGTTSLEDLGGGSSLFGNLFGTDPETGEPLSPQSLLDQVTLVSEGLAEKKELLNEVFGGEAGAGAELATAGFGILGNLFGADAEGVPLTPEGIFESVSGITEGLMEQKEAFGELFGPEAAAGLEAASIGFGLLGNLFGTDEEGMPLSPEGVLEQAGAAFTSMLDLRTVAGDQQAAAEKEAQDKISAEAQKGSKMREGFLSAEADASLQSIGQAFGQAGTALMESGSKKMFKVGKALAISSAVIDTFRGAASAFTSLSGIPFVGPVLGAAAAAAAIVAGVQRVNKIKSQQFGSSGSVGGASAPAMPSIPASAGAGAPGTDTPTLPQSAQAAGTPRDIAIRIDSDAGVVSTEWVRDKLIPSINEAVGDGVVINVNS